MKKNKGGKDTIDYIIERSQSDNDQSIEVVASHRYIITDKDGNKQERLCTDELPIGKYDLTNVSDGGGDVDIQEEK